MLTIAKIETSIAFLEIKNDILHVVFKPHADATLERVKETIVARNKLINGKETLVLIDNRELWQVSPDANEYSASEEVNKLTKAMAIVSGDSFPARLISNFFILLNKHIKPTKLFKNEEDALEWLESYR